MVPCDPLTWVSPPTLPFCVSMSQKAYSLKLHEKIFFLVHLEPPVTYQSGVIIKNMQLKRNIIFELLVDMTNMPDKFGKD